MSDIRKYPYWAVVKFDLIVKEFEPEFMAYFDDHIRELAERVGFIRAWRTRELRHAPNEGLLEQEFCQIYQIDDPARFTGSTPSRPVAPATHKEPFRRDLVNWNRPFYRVLSAPEKDSRSGSCWARFEVNFRGRPAHEAAFERDHARHVARVLELSGIHRAWQLKHVAHELQIGPNPVGRYMTVYEVDAPENVFDPSLGAERLPWRSAKWDVQAASLARHFSRLLLAVKATNKSRQTPAEKKEASKKRRR